MKTKKAMKKITHIGMAALVAMGMLGTSCNKAESPEMETPETQKENIVTLTTTVGFAADDTKALTSTGVKTFAVGETMVLRYKNTKDDWVKAVSNALEPGDIADGSKSATFTFILTNPNKSGNVDYIYPAAIVNELGNMDEAALFGSQDGTLNKIASTFDYSRKMGAWDGENLPSLTLENQLAILAITLKDEAGTSEITGSITGLTLSDGTKTYNVNRSAVAGPIYVAIYPTEDATITVTATDGMKNYTKTLTGKTYAKGNGYPVSWKMTQVATDLSTLTADYTAQDGDILTGTLGSNVKISIADGATVTLKDVNITNLGNNCDWAGINCPGDATLVLEGTNEVCAGRDGSGYNNYPGIYIAPGKTLTIQGDGTLTAYSNSSPWGAGIGGGYYISCGNIVINSGNITATGGPQSAGIGGGYNGSCGNITINGGTVEATGGQSGAGIGGSNASCGNITINGGTITATGGQYSAGIGGGFASCGNITISGGNITATGGQYGAGIGGGNNRTCGDITISGGTTTATGGDLAAGIGGGSNNPGCGTITIKSTVTSVTATKGNDPNNYVQSIGCGDHGYEITVTIEAGANVTQN